MKFRYLIMNYLIVLMLVGCVSNNIQTNEQENSIYIAERTFVEFQKTILLYSNKQEYNKEILQDLLIFEDSLQNSFEDYYRQPKMLKLMKIQKMLIEVQEYLKTKDLKLWMR